MRFEFGVMNGKEYIVVGDAVIVNDTLSAARTREVILSLQDELEIGA